MLTEILRLVLEDEEDAVIHTDEVSTLVYAWSRAEVHRIPHGHLRLNTSTGAKNDRLVSEFLEQIKQGIQDERFRMGGQADWVSSVALAYRPSRVGRVSRTL